MSIDFGYAWVGGDNTQPDIWDPICGDGFRIGVEQWDDANTGSGDGCSPSCTIEIGYVCNGGSGK